MPGFDLIFIPAQNKQNIWIYHKREKPEWVTV